MFFICFVFVFYLFCICFVFVLYLFCICFLFVLYLFCLKCSTLSWSIDGLYSRLWLALSCSGKDIRTCKYKFLEMDLTDFFFVVKTLLDFKIYCYYKLYGGGAKLPVLLLSVRYKWRCSEDQEKLFESEIFWNFIGFLPEKANHCKGHWTNMGTHPE